MPAPNGSTGLPIDNVGNQRFQLMATAGRSADYSYSMCKHSFHGTYYTINAFPFERQKEVDGKVDRVDWQGKRARAMSPPCTTKVLQIMLFPFLTATDDPQFMV